MLPVKEEKKNLLRCRECSWSKPMKDEKYTVEFRVKHSPKEKIVVVEDETSSQNEMTEDEKRERRKAILEFYDSED